MWTQCSTLLLLCTVCRTVQVNAAAAAVLYRLVGEWAAPTPDAVLVDVCCGTGTIGISLARRVRQVVGVDLVPSAIEDAKVNAQLNGVTNITFECGKAEQVRCCFAGHGNEVMRTVVAWCGTRRCDSLMRDTPCLWYGLGWIGLRCCRRCSKSTRALATSWWRWWTPHAPACTRRCCARC